MLKVILLITLIFIKLSSANGELYEYPEYEYYDDEVNATIIAPTASEFPEDDATPAAPTTVGDTTTEEPTTAEAVAATCDETPSLTHGSVGTCAAGNATGTSCPLTCDVGYFITGDGTITCTEDASMIGVWNISDTVCNVVTCNEEPSLDHGSVGTCEAGNPYWTNCRLTCDVGYYITGNGTISCTDDSSSDKNENGTWEIGDTKCKAVICNDEPSLDHGSVGSCEVGNPYWTNCPLTCDVGYYITGNGTISCTDDSSSDKNMYGTWEIGDTKCEVVTCTDDPSLDHGSVGSCEAGNPYWTNCPLTCDVGYYITGNGTISCTDDSSSDKNEYGTWEIGDTTCKAVTCNEKPSLDHGSVGSCEAGNPYWTNCPLTCDVGYYITGNGTISCTDSDSSDENVYGTWEIGDTKCKAVTCNEEPSLDHGSVGSCEAGNPYWTNCPLTCDVGYYITGNGTISCTDDSSSDENMYGTWEIGDTKCQAYMVITTMNQTANDAVKYRNVTLQVKVESLAKDDVDITVYLVSKPGDSNSPIKLEETELETSNVSRTFEFPIENVMETDEGIYEFKSLSSSQNTELYPNITEYVYQRLEVQVIPEDLTLTPLGQVFNYTRGSDNNKIVCEAYADPQADYTWEADSGANETGGISSENNTLLLEDAYFSDNGSFICYPSNNISMESGEHPSISIYIEVQGVPVIKGNGNSYPPQDDIFLNCTMDANPLPNVTWKSNGTDYSPSDVFVSYDLTTNPSGAYYMYENQLSLTSQLCMGRQEVKCSPSNKIGPSQKEQVFLINDGDYDLHGEKYYTFPVTGTSSSDAQQKCESASGHLVYIENEDLQEYLNNMTSEKFYIGAVKNGEDWTWGDNGPPLTYENFTDESADGDCVVSSASGWETVNCSDSYNYVCELNASGIPQNLNVDTDQCNGTKLKVSWTPDDNYAKTLHRVLITAINGSNVGVLENTIANGSQIELSNAKPDTQYTVQVFAAVDRCIQFFPSVKTLDTTGFGKPKQVIDASIIQLEGTQKCKVTWEYDETFKWQINNYTVTVTTTLLDDTPAPASTYTEQSTSYEFSMSPNSKYSVSIAAKSCGGTGDDKVAPGECTRGVSSPQEVSYTKPVVKKEDDGTVHISNSDGIPVNVSAQNQRNGPVSCVWVVATYDGSKEESDGRDSNITMDKFNAISNGSSYQEYFAYVSNNASDPFIIKLGVEKESTSCTPDGTNPGNSKRRKRATGSVNATNLALLKGRYYRYYIVTTTPNGDAFLILANPISDIWRTNPENYGWIAGVIVPVCLIIIISSVYYVRRKRKADQHEQDAPFEDHDNPVYDEINDGPDDSAIKGRDLENVFRFKHMDEDRLFRDEYKGLRDMAKRLEPRFSQAKEMRALNRFVNVLPANDATVRLHGEGYINASYLDGYRQSRKFIATQGPKPNTIDHFWTMVWEKDVKVIVMLTNVDENGRRKCEKYWPDQDEELNFGHTVVKGTGCSTYGTIVRREFVVYPARAPQQDHTVIQLHYIAWPDHGVPLTTTDLFNLRRMVRSEFGRGEEPIVVHCSAGVGRTGTFIALDFLMEQLKAEEEVDIRMQVWRMRQNRTEMVQTSDQYVLLHKMLLEAYLLKDKDMDLNEAEEKLKRIRTGRGSEVEDEFALIGRVPAMVTEKENGSSAENRDHNRDDAVVPYDHNIVNIRMRPEERQAPYLNASKIDGYETADKYIVTQDPTPGNEELLWRMILDHGVKCMVMIRKADEGSCAPYWSDEMSKEFGRITVMVNETFKDKNVIERQIFVKETVLNSTRSVTVQHIEFAAWPEKPEEGAEALIDLVNRVQRQKQGPARGGPVVVHCGDGSERTGTFCAVAKLIERLKIESRVNVLGTAKDLRDLRANMISDANEYRLCYYAIQSYLSAFEMYSNFQSAS